MDELYIQRCLNLAKLGIGKVSPNPMVGAVLVHNSKIIGEGYHKNYGHSHAEVNCIQSVRSKDKHLIKESVLYVSLEPCAHFGKTPPCTDLIIREKIPKVVIGCRDIFSEVNGKGIEKMRANGVEVVEGILDSESRALNRRFFTFHSLKRPYLILKWAETEDGKIALDDPGKRLFITDDIRNRLVHKWRSNEAGILIGKNTALYDDPQLTNRLWSGKSPIRLIIDLDLKLPKNLKIFENDVTTIIFNWHKQSEYSFTGQKEIYYQQINKNQSLHTQILNACYELNIQSILIEGGAKTLQSFIDDELWDEVKIIKNKNLNTQGLGLDAPLVSNGSWFKKVELSDNFQLKKIKK